MKNGGEKRWNVVVIHETFKIYQQMGKLFSKEDTTQ